MDSEVSKDESLEDFVPINGIGAEASKEGFEDAEGHWGLGWFWRLGVGWIGWDFDGDSFLDFFAAAIEDAIDEAARFVRAIFFGDFDGFVDGDGGGDIGASEELVESDAEDVAVNGGDALELVILAAFADDGIDFILEVEDAGDELAAEGASAGACVADFEEGFECIGVVCAAEVSEEEELHCGFASFASCAHGSEKGWGLGGDGFDGSAVWAEFFEDADAIDCGASGFDAAVELGVEAAEVGLVGGIEEEDLVNDRGFVVEGKAHECVGYCAGDEVSVGGFAAEDDAEGDDGVEFFAVEEGLSDDGDFEGAGGEGADDFCRGLDGLDFVACGFSHWGDEFVVIDAFDDGVAVGGFGAEAWSLRDVGSHTG